MTESIYIVGIAFAVIALAVYFLCWLKSKDMHYKWIIASLVLFCIDVVFNILIFGFTVDSIIDYVFSAYVIYSIATGITSYTKLSKLPEPIADIEAAPEDDFGFVEQAPAENTENDNETK